jgi:hypothetical protein
MRNGYATCSDDSDKYLHVAIAEKALGRPLPPKAEVHHVDGNKLNNAPSNLVICPDHSYHALLHARQRILDAGGVPGKDKVCFACGRLLEVSAFVKNKRMYDGLHSKCRECVSSYKKAKGYNVAKFDERAKELQRLRRARGN